MPAASEPQRMLEDDVRAAGYLRKAKQDGNVIAAHGRTANTTHLMAGDYTNVPLRGVVYRNGPGL